MRQVTLTKTLAKAANVPVTHVDRMLQTLLQDDKVLAELMALCARPGPSDNDSDWEFVRGEPKAFSESWTHGGSGLDVTHHLPEPNKPGGTG